MDKEIKKALLGRIRDMEEAHFDALYNDGELMKLLSQDQRDNIGDGLVSSSEISIWLLDILAPL